MTYDELLIQADLEGLKVKEKPLQGGDGRIFNNRIAIRRDINTTIEKSCVLAEEIGHYRTGYGDITRLDTISDQKQEYRARMTGYDIKIGLSGIICAFEKGVRSKAEMADYLDVTEEYLIAALDAYRKKYGKYVSFENYTIFFEPYFVVCKAFEDFTD